MKSNLKVIICYLLAIAAVIGVIAVIYRTTTGQQEALTYDKVISYFQNQEVRSFKVDNKNNLTMMVVTKDANGNIVTGTNGEEILVKKTYKLDRVDYFHEDLDDLILAQIQSGVILGAFKSLNHNFCSRLACTKGKW